MDWKTHLRPNSSKIDARVHKASTTYKQLEINQIVVCVPRGFAVLFHWKATDETNQLLPYATRIVDSRKTECSLTLSGIENHAYNSVGIGVPIQ